METGLGKIQNSYNKKRSFLEKQLGDIEILILGNSRSLQGINPSAFKYKGFNLSNNSQTIYYNARLGLKFIPQMKKLKCVIIDIPPQGFGICLNDGIEHWRDFFYYQFWDIKSADFKWYEINNYSKIFLYEPQKSFLYSLKNFKVDLAKDLTSNGWVFKDSIKSKSLIGNDEGKIRAEFNNQIFKENRFIENTVYLERLVSFIKEKNIPCFIISSPVYFTYSKFADEQREKRGIEAIESICKRYNCHYFNYYRDSRFNQDDYADNDHLSFVGAKKYSKIVADEIINQYLN